RFNNLNEFTTDGPSNVDVPSGVGGDAITDDPVVDAGRPKRSPKFSSMVKSPFNQSDVIIYQTLSLDYAVKRDVVACLTPNTPISEALIDLWARIMNSNEKLGSRGSVACFFATTRPCNEYVFPMHSDGFSGLICISPGDQKLYILDSAGFCKDATIRKSVSSNATILRQSLAKYMGHTSMSKSSKAVTLSMPDFVDLSWTEGVDVVDAGVVTMRHMETFKGRITPHWNPDVKRANKRQIDLMRRRYCYVIAFAPFNKLKNENLAQSNRFQLKKGDFV
ncbi:Unknown protein, partial [Striga hermonthica]